MVDVWASTNVLAMMAGLEPAALCLTAKLSIIVPGMGFVCPVTCVVVTQVSLEPTAVALSTVVSLLIAVDTVFVFRPKQKRYRAGNTLILLLLTVSRHETALLFHI